MASDLSSGCTEVIEILDEKEEGEISLEDVSSSEEGQLNDGCNSRRRAAGQCPSCLSTKHCASWCTIPTKRSHSKTSTKKDAVQEKENCHHTKDSGYLGSKHPASTLQENNNDLIPISSDSDMEIVGLADNVKPALVLPQAKTPKVRKRRRKRRSQNPSATAENLPISNPPSTTEPEFSLGPKHDSQILKDNHLLRAHRRESNSPHKLSTGSQTFTRSRAVKSPLRRHRSPFGRARSPVLRKSPVRRPRSPPPLSPVRRQLRGSLSPSNPPADMYGDVNKLLKKVRHLKTVGTHSANRSSGKRRGRGPSLKDKLNNMMKSNDAGGNAGHEEFGTADTERKSIENVDDEEDLALLRKMALETKPKWNEKPEEKEAKEETQGGNNNIGDDDVEDLELRMIALRSAMLKKHQDRMQRGVVPGKTKKPAVLARSSTESPFSQSFLDSIPIPGDDNEKESKTPLRTPTEVLNENTNPEDMELDSEVELEKEKGSDPYSPTDDISRHINVDSELLGIQPSDVLFITPTSQATTVPNTSNFQTSESDNIDIIETGASYLRSNEKTDIQSPFLSESNYYSNPNVLPSSQSPASSLYSPVNAAETVGINSSAQSDENLIAAPYSPSQPIETPTVYFSPESDPFFNSDPNLIPDTPYSPTDTPIYDPELNNPPLLPNTPLFTESNAISRSLDNPLKEREGKKWLKIKPVSTLIRIKLLPNLPKDVDTPSEINAAEASLPTSELPTSLYPVNVVLEKDNLSETSSMKADVGSAINSPASSPDCTMITVDDLPETDLDGSPLIPVTREIQDMEIHVPSVLSDDTVPKVTQEPLYLLGVPDVTKDANKIPTLVNRSLVPASILKSNKNLQQPLPPKKMEPHLEPAFKSAQMQPVQISNETSKTNRLFKPIKLAPVMKKPKLTMVTPAAFNCSSNDNSVLEEQGEYQYPKSTQEAGKNEQGNLSEDLQNEQAIQALSKVWEATDLGQTENGVRIVQSKTTLLPSSEPWTNLVQDRGKNSLDAFRVSNRKSGENMEGSFLGKEKKTRSRRSKSDKSRSKHAGKMGKEDKSLETKDGMGNTLKSAITEGTACIDVSSIHKQSSNSNKTNKNHSPEDFIQKKRNSRDKLKKLGQDKSKRDREERRNRRSAHKYDKVSNSYKKTDASKPEDRRTSMKKQQEQNTEVLGGTEHSSQNSLVSGEHRENSISQSHSIDVENADDNSALKLPKAGSNIHEYNPSANITGSRLSELNKPDVDISNAAASPCNLETKSVENSALVSDVRPQDGQDSTPDNTACKKVQASKRRRSSLDDDEEALRAILLASLAKRSKPSDPVNDTPKSNPLANLTYTSENTSTESVRGLPTTPGMEIPVNLVYSSSSDATPPSLVSNIPTLNNSDNKDSNLGTLPQAEIPDTVIAENTVITKVAQEQTAPAVAPLRKRSISAGAKAPVKKVAKKVPISASTKVVNNAKKYQNTLVQKKLNLQKVAMISNAQKTMNCTNLHHNKVLDGGRTRSMITQPLSDTQRFVINLASDSESENETETVNKNPDEPLNTNTSEQKPVLAIPMSDFEKSVDLFLKDVRKKQETAAAIKPSSATTVVTQKPASPVTSVHRKSPVLSTTPLAVRHLPVSLQEEYRRLKQQILEREKLKLYRVLVNNTSPLSPGSKSSGTPPGPLSPASPIASPTISKQTHNIPPSSQSLVSTVPKDSSSRSISVQSNPKQIVSGIAARVSPAVSKANAPMPSVSSLSIQIPNETTNVNLAHKKSSNHYIPVSSSQSRLVTAVKQTRDVSNTKDLKDSAVPVKDQLSLKNVQVQLQQGKTGRRVSLGETFNLSTKAVVTKNRKAEAQESPANKASGGVDSNPTVKNVPPSLSSGSSLADSQKIIDTVDVRGECDNSVDSAASTLIISRDQENTENSSLVDCSVSTVIISRDKNADNTRLESLSSESSKVNSSISKSPIGPRKVKNNTETWEKIRGDVRKELDTISALPTSEQKTYLATAEQNLVKKRYAILDDLSEISGNLKQLEMEREVQSNMASEVRKLQEQLKIAEERLHAQRSRVNKMVPNITAAYEKFNNGRRECVKMTRICLGLGCLVIGDNYKIPAAGAQLLNNRLKQVAGCTRQLSSKKMSVTVNRDDGKGKVDSPSEISSIDNCLNSPISESTPSTISENTTQEGEDSATIGGDVVTEEPKNSNTEFAASIEADRMDITEQETMKLGETTAASIAHDSPPLTSTPNSSKDSSEGIKYAEEPGTSVSTFVLDDQGAGISGKKDCSKQRRLLQPYKSVLTHLTVQRTTDPSGILCPYELMGTCRDEDCQFVHQSIRNGNISSGVWSIAAAESIPLVAAATPRDGKLSS